VQEAWNTPTLLNGWVAFGGSTETASYYKDEFGVVHIRGMIKGGTGTDGTTIFNLPIGYRPSNNKYITIANNNAFAVLSIKTTGNVDTNMTVSNVWISLDNISFKVGN
jgi:hypothetical protein